MKHRQVFPHAEDFSLTRGDEALPWGDAALAPAAGLGCADGVETFLALEVFREAKALEAQGRRVFHLEIGEPAGGAPEAAKQAARAALDHGHLGYTVALGLPELREAVADMYRRWHGIDLDPARVAVTAGASGAFMLAFLAAIPPGGRVALADPGYPAYRNILKALGRRPVAVPASPELGFQPSVAQLEEAGELDGLILASPANPTGNVLDAGRLAELAGWAQARGVTLICDEIYHGLTFEQPAGSVLAHDANAVVVNSFSKYFCMTGWRLGWLVLPERLVEPVERLAQNLYIAPSTIAQHAALGALRAEDELNARVVGLKRNRDRLVRALRAGGAKVTPAQGAFYLYADVSRFTDDSVGWCKRLLRETGVALTPGADFDPIRGNRYVRLSFAGDEAVIEEAAGRLEKWLKG